MADRSFETEHKAVRPRLGVVIVTYNASDVILDCLESLLASSGVDLRIVVVDNGSSDGTPAGLRAWAEGARPYLASADLPVAVAAHPKPLSLADVEAPDAAAAWVEDGAIAGAGHRIALMETGRNTGFAGGVNRGLRLLATDAGLDRFWVLNPDSVVPADTALRFATAQFGEGGDRFALMAGRVIYLDSPDHIQVDGGRIDWRTGVTHNINQFRPPDIPAPDPSEIDFVMGGSMIVSRRFLESAGPMPEDYFLYYEEVDWALRRGDLPLAYCAGAPIYHRAGSAIGSAGPGRPATPFSLYFKHRSRMMFAQRHRDVSRLGALAYSAAKTVQLLLGGHLAEAGAVMRGTLGRKPSRAVASRLSDEAFRMLFGSARPG